MEDGMRNRNAIGWAAGLILLMSVACSLFGAARGPLKFEPQVLPDAAVGAPYEARISISENVTPAGEFSIAEGALPKGLKMEKVEGADAARIMGTPEETGTFHFKVFVWCYGTNVSGQEGEMEYSLTV